MSKEKDNNTEDIKKEQEELSNTNEEPKAETQEEKAEATEEKVQDNNAKDSEAEEKTEEKDPLKEAQEQLEAMKDKYLRSVAEFDNYRKRCMKEKAELLLNGAEKTVLAILPIIDDMERAMASGEKTDDPKVLREGMEIIFHKLEKTLGSLGVKKIDTADADFDTDYHEAIAMVPGMGDDKKGKVIDCVQTGYTLNDKVIRHAKVAVGQ